MEAFSIHDILKDPRIEEITLEVFRMFGPAPISSSRIFTKNVTLEGYKFRKGDEFIYPLSLRNYTSKTHERAELFDCDRMTEEGRKKFEKIEYIPFSTG